MPASAASKKDDARALVQRAIERDLINWERLRNYTFVENLNARIHLGRATVNSQVKLDVVILYGEPFHRVVERNLVPPSAAEQERTQIYMDRFVSQRRDETPQAKQARLDQELKQHLAERSYLREIPDAFDFHFARSRMIGGQRVLVVDAEPRAGYEPKDNRALILTALRARLWIEPETAAWVKIEAELVSDTDLTVRLNGAAIDVSIDHLREGSRFEFEQQRQDGDVWGPKRSYVRLEGRRNNKDTLVEQTQTESDYKKFRAETTVKPVE